MTQKTRSSSLAGLLTLTWLAAILLTSPCHGCGGGRPPHIVFVLTDDMGWSDVSWNADDTYTPNLDRLRKEGVTLVNHYMQPACAASRAALLTGYYPYRLGLQRNDLGQFHRWRNHSLSNEITILPEYLHRQGYANHLVGKWQMGFCHWEYTPTRRGFNTFYGSYGGNSGHFNHTPDVGGYDFRNNLNVDWSVKGQYSTHLYTQRAIDVIQEHHDTNDTRPLFLFLSYEAPHVPVEVPQNYIDEYCSNVTDPERKKRCGMMAALDEGVNNVTEKLKELGYWDDLLFIFTSDNGAPGQQGGSNWPLRGKKRGVYEGGVRVPSFLHSRSLLRKQPYEYKGLLHVTDWLPTLLTVARMDPDASLPNDINGKDQWDRIRRDEDSRRKEMVYDLDTRENYAAVRIGDCKLVRDNSTRCWGWFNPPAEAKTGKKGGKKGNKKPTKIDCKLHQLFDLAADPNEEKDLSKKRSMRGKLNELKAMLDELMKNATFFPTVANVTESYPENWGGAWSPGWCNTSHAIKLDFPAGLKYP